MTESDNPTIPWYQRVGGAGFAFGMKTSLRFLDCKIAYHDRSFDPRLSEFNETTIGVFWHEYLALLVAMWAGTPVTMLVSQHRDAEWLNQAAERLGFSVVRGSTRRGGSRAIRELRQLCKTNTLGITPDGPQGPRRKMSLGPVFLASLFEMPIVPVGAGYRRPWRLSTWDRFAIAKPFSRARVIAGPKIRVPKNLSRDQMEDYRAQIERVTDELTAHAEDWANSSYDLRGEISFRRGKLIEDEAASLSPPPQATRKAA
jgi:lysophospholipid acyltransferase (LPLAT)-like uncharacterized protein